MLHSNMRLFKLFCNALASITVGQRGKYVAGEATGDRHKERTNMADCEVWHSCNFYRAGCLRCSESRCWQKEPGIYSFRKSFSVSSLGSTLSIKLRYGCLSLLIHGLLGLNIRQLMHYSMKECKITLMSSSEHGDFLDFLECEQFIILCFIQLEIAWKSSG